MYERYVSPYKLLAQRFRSVIPFVVAVVFLSSPSWSVRIIGAMLMLCCWSYWIYRLFRWLGIGFVDREIEKHAATCDKPVVLVMYLSEEDTRYLRNTAWHDQQEAKKVDQGFGQDSALLRVPADWIA